jgi:hypothetical protein
MAKHTSSSWKARIVGETFVSRCARITLLN